VTAPDARDELRELLREHTVGAFAGCDTACACDHRWRTNIAYREHLAEVVTAYAERLARVRAAEELEGAAKGLTILRPFFVGCHEADVFAKAAEMVRDRADALAADDQPDGAR
jgi:hypothetical protein